MQKSASELRMSDWSSDVCYSDLVIADAVACADFPHLKKLDRRPCDMTDVPLHLGHLNAAIDGKARPGEVERIVRAQADSRRIGEAIGICGHRLAKGREGLKLAAVERMGGFIRAGAMAHKRFVHQPVEQAGCSLLR